MNAGMGAALAAQLPPETDAETRAAVEMAGDTLPVSRLLSIMADAQEARALLDAGDREAAMRILEKHRQFAIEAGLGPMYDTAMASVLG